MEKLKNKAVIYARCSTDENKQDVEVQLKELRRYCSAYGWEYDEVSEYGSGFKGDQQPELDALMEKISREATLALARAMMSRESEAIQQVSLGVDESFCECGQLISHCGGMVWITGVGTSAAVAERFAHIHSPKR